MSDHDISYYVQLLKAGEVVAFPTETVYGLGADATNPSAVKKIFNLKERPADNPLIIHVSNVEMAYRFVPRIPEQTRRLMESLWPGPLTLVMKKSSSVLDLVTAGLDTIALRMPDNKTALNLIEKAGPLAAPSANKSGRPSPTSSSHVQTDFGMDFPIVSGERPRIGIESTVLDVSEKPFQILRPGAVSPDQIQQIARGDVISNEQNAPSKQRSSRSPGNKYTHYSPNAQVEWLTTTKTTESTLYILHSQDHVLSRLNEELPASSLIINYKKDYKRLGRELYDRFRQADLQNFSIIAVEPFPAHLLNENNFTVAIQNRIKKAIG